MTVFRHQHVNNDDMHKVRARLPIVCKHWQVDRCVSTYIVAHCVSGFVALWDMTPADVTRSAVGWDFTGFLGFFTAPVTEEGKNALAPGATQVILRNTGDRPMWKHKGCSINPL